MHLLICPSETFWPRCEDWISQMFTKSSERAEPSLALLLCEGLKHPAFNRHSRMPTGERCWKLNFCPPPLAHYGLVGLFTAHKSPVAKKDSNLSALLCSPKDSFTTAKCQAVCSWVWLCVLGRSPVPAPSLSPQGAEGWEHEAAGLRTQKQAAATKRKGKNNKVGTFLFIWAAFFSKFCKMRLLLGFFSPPFLSNPGNDGDFLLER